MYWSNHPREARHLTAVISCGAGVPEGGCRLGGGKLGGRKGVGVKLGGMGNVLCPPLPRALNIQEGVHSASREKVRSSSILSAKQSA